MTRELPDLAHELIEIAAYLKWEAAGGPDDRALEFWLEAEAEQTGNDEDCCGHAPCTVNPGHPIHSSGTIRSPQADETPPWNIQLK